MSEKGPTENRSANSTTAMTKNIFWSEKKEEKDGVRLTVSVPGDSISHTS